MLRKLLVGLFLLVPVAAHADDTVPIGNSLQSANASAAVGNQTSGTLQPASTSTGSTLQSGSGAGVGQSAQDQSTTLQSPATSDQAKLYIQGDIDSTGTPQSSKSYTWLLYLVLILVATTALTSALWLWQRRVLKQIAK